MVLIVADGGHLISMIDRADLHRTTVGSARVAELGSLTDRTASPGETLDGATARLMRTGRRRLAIVDDFGRLLGRPCLKKNGMGRRFDASIHECTQAVPRRGADRNSPALA
jgi:hypothetical protein